MLSTYTLKYPVTGIGWYTHYLKKGLQAHSAISQLACLPVLSDKHDYSKKNKYFQAKIKKVIRSWVGSYNGLNYYRNYIFNKKTRRLAQENFIYHEPCYILRPYSGLKICSVHDLSHLYYPEYHPVERVKFLLRYLGRSLKNAHHIITGSCFIRRQIIDYFKIPPEKISAIYHGVSDVFRPRQSSDINTVIRRYGLLDKSYLLSVGTLEPRKNLERLIQAFSTLPEQQRKKHPLVLVGVKGWGRFSSIALINQLHAKEQLIFLGYVPSADLPFLYSGAYAFAYLSLYEGFGLPILEAMASGIPTLASNVSSLQEVVSSAGLLVDPFDVYTIKGQLQQLLGDNYLRAKLKQQGFTQASQFSWKLCLENTVSVYKNVLNSFS
ncbi:glycosyltransferase family 4 protein [Rickettsiella endosymbiont of Dermanyssus gallinae]|uniref:glycosyltransferase family 4 protein n=1 Tax=Rickettsiella endosymbiont of Dermanyssus gallinae TaxID=2856608 RepID=UPI001C52810C|nr:glycosyltransferase family 1 protein [Rickettsiella endosymbiont of Dermanyssus gallinae]